MGAVTGIKWTDSTWNSWWGCSKAGPACDHCYAEGVDKRTGANHWGPGVPRRRLSAHARHEPYRWQRRADAFEAEHGRRQRVFTLSMGDLFDNEVPEDWRFDHLQTMAQCNRLDWQICTKRIGNVRKMVPPSWLHCWPRHVGVLVTTVTQKEADRDIPKLLDLKGNSFVPWVGVSYEPAQEAIEFREYLEGEDKLDWIIFGGKSGPKWNDRPFSVEWGAAVAMRCAWTGTAFFFKQVAAARPTDAMIPPELLIRQFPEWVR